MRLLYFLLLFCLCFLSPLSLRSAEAPLLLKEKIRDAGAGDYIVTEVSKNYSVLLIRSVSKETILIEEITAPASQFKALPTSWKEWVHSGAPGHTSWVLYDISLKKNTLIQTYSFTRKGWLYPESSECFLASLISLPLKRIPEAQRKRIGPPPPSGEQDQRKIWTPELHFEGQRAPQLRLDAWKTRWPVDDSLLSGCEIELYFAKAPLSFALPFWIEIKSTHYNFKIRTIDAGKGLVSPQKSPLFNGE